MASLRQIKSKINSVQGTKRIMNAMKLISTAKLQRAEERLYAYRAYSNIFEEIAKNLAARCEPENHPLLHREERKKLQIVLMTSDRGLCGSFNSNLIRRLGRHLTNEAKGYEEITFRFVGKKGRDHFRRRDAEIHETHTGVDEKNYDEYTDEIAGELTEEFLEGRFDEIVLVYAYYESALSQSVRLEPLLPVEPEEDIEKEASGSVDYIYEPSMDEVLDFVLNEYVRVRIQRALLESVTSEHGARMTAMDNATKNAEEVIDDLTMEYNQTRQNKITMELMDIVNGAEALRDEGGM